MTADRRRARDRAAAVAVIALVVLASCETQAPTTSSESADAHALDQRAHAGSGVDGPGIPAAVADLRTWRLVRRSGAVSAHQPLAVRSDDDVLALDGQATPCYFPGEDIPAYELRASLFSAAAGSFDESGALDTHRESFVMAQLPDGEVLVTGGYNDHGTPKFSTRIWEPATDSGSMAHSNIARAGAVAAPLDDGRVLVVGGWAPGGSTR